MRFKKAVLLFLSLWLCANCSLAKEHFLSKSFSGYMHGRGPKGTTQPKPEKIEFLPGINFPEKLSRLAVQNEVKKISLTELIASYKEAGFSQKDEFFKAIKSFLKSKMGLEPFTQQKIGPLQTCACVKDIFLLRKQCKVLTMMSRMYGNQKGGRASALLLASAIYSANLVMSGGILDHSLSNYLFAYVILSIPTYGIMGSFDDFAFTKEAAQVVFKAYYETERSLPRLSYLAKIEKNYFNLFHHTITKFFKDLLEKGEQEGQSTEKDRKEINQVIAKADEAKKTANSIFKELLDTKFVIALSSPFDPGNKYIEQRDQKLQKLVSEVLEAQDSVANIDDISGEIIGKSWIGRYCLDGHRFAKALWNCKQRIECAKTLVAISAYKTEEKKWPESLEALEKWFGDTLGRDFFTGKPLIYDPAKKILKSNGPDKLPNTEDDIVALPYKFDQ